MTSDGDTVDRDRREAYGEPSKRERKRGKTSPDSTRSRRAKERTITLKHERRRKGVRS